MRNPNLEQLVRAAVLLRPILGELVFVGGCVTGLLITDEAAGDPRATVDVDAIAEISSYADYAVFGSRLRALGFSEDTRDGAPLCRWVHGPSVLDVMPIDERILGFSNRWYREAMDSSEVCTLEGDLEIRTVTAPLFVATKLEAFKGRGGRDYLCSRDLEDLVAVVDGRATLTTEVRASSPEVRGYIREEISALLVSRRFVDAIAGYLLPDAASQSRAGIVLRRLQELAS